jgi:hypothetical protein
LKDETIAEAMILLHGSPPLALRWRPGGFAKRTDGARQYCYALEALLSEAMPGIKPDRRGIRRNRVLRIIFARLGRVPKEVSDAWNTSAAV